MRSPEPQYEAILRSIDVLQSTCLTLLDFVEMPGEIKLRARQDLAKAHEDLVEQIYSEWCEQP